MNALDLLIADHNRVRGLFAKFKVAKDKDDTAAMSDVARKIFEDLEVHTTIEEEIFYPTVHDANAEVAGLVDEGVEEHHVVKLLMSELKELQEGSPDWIAKMTVLIENVEHHADEEEKEMFPPLRKRIDDRLADRLEARKKDLGASVLADKIDLTKEELLELAKQQEIPGRSTMSQEELAATVAPAS
jgi:hemerythrin superfamily protein